MKSKNLNILTNGIIKENPVLRLMLGTCPTLAVTTAAINGIGMGIAATIVLVCSNLVISLLRNFIPDKVRIPAYITIIAGFVSVVQMLVKAFTPAIDESLGIFLPLIVVNCIILARAEMFASKNPVLPSVLDGLGMGIGFTATLTLMGAIRELFGAGSIFSLQLIPESISPMIIFLLPPGGFFVFGILVAVSNAIAKRQGKPVVEHLGCANCPARAACKNATLDSEQSVTECVAKEQPAVEQEEVEAKKEVKPKTKKPAKQPTEQKTEEKEEKVGGGDE
ncbi:MAG: electron transport complex subunit E [Clostridia bacterium]|nr:electron transport complex subunit E [Clostridia bacterium]